MKDTVLRAIIRGNSEYYIALKNGVSNGYNQYPDEIYLIGIPETIPRNSDIDKIVYGELLRLSESVIDYNIPLNGNIPPFQRGLTLGSFCEVEKLQNFSNKLLIGLLEINSNKFIDYLNFLNEFAPEIGFVSK